MVSNKKQKAIAEKKAEAAISLAVFIFRLYTPTVIGRAIKRELQIGATEHAWCGNYGSLQYLRQIMFLCCAMCSVNQLLFLILLLMVRRCPPASGFGV